MIFLTVWFLMVQPNPSVSIPRPDAYQVGSEPYKSAAECSAAATTLIPLVIASAQDVKKNKLKPENWVSATHTCEPKEF